MNVWWWWCHTLDEWIRALASNFFQTVITPMPLEEFLHFKLSYKREFKGLSEYVKKIGKKSAKVPENGG